MWVDEDGHSHSEAVVNPAAHLSDRARAAVAAADPKQIERELRDLDPMLDRLFDRLEAAMPPDRDDRFVGVPLPDAFVFDFEGSSVTDPLRVWVEGLPLRWQIDAYVAATTAISDIIDPPDPGADPPALRISSADWSALRDIVWRWDPLGLGAAARPHIDAEYDDFIVMMLEGFGAGNPPATIARDLATVLVRGWLGHEDRHDAVSVISAREPEALALVLAAQARLSAGTGAGAPSSTLDP